MDTSGNSPQQARPEQVLSAALRAQAAGNGTPEAQPHSASSPTGPPSDTSSPATLSGSAPTKLPVVRVLLFVLVLGLLAGAIVGALTAV